MRLTDSFELKSRTKNNSLATCRSLSAEFAIVPIRKFLSFLFTSYAFERFVSFVDICKNFRPVFTRNDSILFINKQVNA